MTTSSRYAQSTPIRSNVSSGDRNIDALVADYRWQSRNVSFSFTNSFRSDYEDEFAYLNSTEHQPSFRSFTRSQKRQMRRIISREIEAVSNLNLIELKGKQDRNATIRIARSDVPSTAFAYLPTDEISRIYESGDIWFNRTDFSNPNIGSYAYYGFMHELGHSLGLEHGHESNGIENQNLSPQRDSNEFSIMTYRESVDASIFDGFTTENGGYAQSLMMQDIAALQHLYGANYDTRSGNTTYTFSPDTGQIFYNGQGQGKPAKNRIFRTVWDGGGNDTYNLSNYTRSLSIDLNPGRWSDFDLNGNRQRSKLNDEFFSLSPTYARGHLFNALLHEGNRRSLIENAIGGTRDDRLTGNTARNRLEGRQGNDRLLGRSGRDVLLGQQGNDFLVGGSGNDLLRGDVGRDNLWGSDEEARGRGEVDRLYGGKASDTFHLGEKGTVFYRDNLNVGDRSYARLLDFDALGNDADHINVVGARSNYRVQSVQIGQQDGVGIYWDGTQGNDLLAFISDDSLSVAQVRSRLV